MNNGKEKRRSVRGEATDMIADVSNGRLIFKDCEIRNVSSLGISLYGVPEKFSYVDKLADATFTAVITRRERRIKVKLYPRWVGIGSRTFIGFEIRENVDSWKSFIGVIHTNQKAMNDTWETEYSRCGHSVFSL